MKHVAMNSGGEQGRTTLSQEHLETIFNASHDVVFVLDGERNVILHVNDTVERVLGYRPDELSGRPFGDILAEAAPDYLEHSRFSDGVFGPVSVLRSDGTLCQADVTVAVIPWDGSPALLYTLRDATQRSALEEEKAALIHDLQQALAAVQRLSGLLPICANCKRIRDDEGYWETVESYISAHAGVKFSHSICPNCRAELYPEYDPGRAPPINTPPDNKDAKFHGAMERLENFTGPIDRVTKLRLYALQQQGLLGDCGVAHIDFTDGAARARVDSWKALQGMPVARAQLLYTNLVAEITSPGAHPRDTGGPEADDSRKNGDTAQGGE